MRKELAPQYDASLIESKWYQQWENAGLFSSNKTGAPKFTISIPPPNVTGSLHMGHSLCYPIQDVIGRFRRLRGYDVLIIPGQDHAGIALQSVVSKTLKAQGINPTELGREKFIEKAWEFRHEYGDTILQQFRSLGCAFDWSLARFTLDEKYVQAVQKVFIDWIHRGLVYRGKRVVNWDPVLKTSVSDIETIREEVNGKLYHVRYPFADGTGEVIIATTRPETMLGDVAVAVNPSDKRYTQVIGKSLRLPLQNRDIPLVADPYPDPEFGTGAVKVTPAHDPNDYEVGVRQNLPMPIVLDEDANVCAEGKYFGMNRFEARKAIVKDLEEQGFLVKIEDHKIPIIKSDRSGEIIEPLLSEQWFVKQTELAAPAIEAVKSGKITFIPDRYNKVYLDWLENIRDWCVSRQLWWGHRVPVYYTESGEAFAAQSWEEAQAQTEQKIVRQDEDVLDTWFSSGLWPFAIMGWPEQTDFLKDKYPTQVLVTDRNIIYLWVARMIMMGLDFLHEIPFSEVVIHATVLTEDGKRMSKSLGTGVDPMGVINSKGADSLRYTLLSQAGMNQEIRYSEKRTDDARNFCNKIWNAARYVMINLPEEVVTKPDTLEPTDQWILSRLAKTEETARQAYEAYDFLAASQCLYAFFWGEVCDWYLEISKQRLSEQACRWTLLEIFDAFLKMLHPIMPFITEELYQTLPIADKSDYLMNADWPTGIQEYKNEGAEQTVETWLEITRAFRALRAELNITPRQMIEEAYVQGELNGAESVLKSQGWVKNLQSGKPTDRAVSTHVKGVDLFIPSQGLINPEKLKLEGEKIQLELEKLQKRLGNEDFVSRAKPEVVQRDKEAVAELTKKLEKINEQLGRP